MPTCPPATLEEICTGFKQRLESIGDPLRAYATEPDQSNLPAAYPRLVGGLLASDFDGDAEWSFDVWVLVSLENGFNRAQTILESYLSLAGRKSIVQAIEDDRTLGGKVSSLVCQTVGAPGRADVGGVPVLANNVRVLVYA
ncbi:MAG TPA: hypothetical protein VKG20_12860 [Methylomirabilota bacterium]|nr:hypothetical protein [Methylomirabilota bacterium]